MGWKTAPRFCFSRSKMAKVLLLLMAIYIISGLAVAAEEEVDSQEVNEEESEGRMRLPNVVHPNHYQLTLLPILDKNPRLCGHVWINVTVQLLTKAIVLHAFQIIPVEVVVYPDSVEIDMDETKQVVEETCFLGGLLEDDDDDGNRRDKAARNDMVEDLHFDHEDEQLVIILKDALPAGKVYRIGIHYHAEIYDSDNIGFFRVENKLNKNDCCEKWIGATQLEATHARKVFPCLDEPAFKATFELTVGHPNRMRAISNMPRNSTTSLKNMEDWSWDTFETTPAMSTYLLACILSELEYLESSYRSIDGRNITIKLWSDKEKFDQLQLAYHLIPKVMETLENYLNIPYSLPKLDMVAMPGYDAARAMENWGLIVQSDASLFIGKDSSVMEKTLFALTIVHEIAHQWFGNLVTSRWWDDIWLNEGLSTLFENIILKQVAPDLTPDVVIALFSQQAFFHDKVATSLPLNYPAQLLPTIEHKFDGFTYAKSSVIFRMVRNFIGEDGFRTALKRYFVRFQYQNANSTDLWVLLTQEARRTHTINSRMNVARIMRTWTQQPGHPLVTVERNPNGTFQLTQAVFVDPDFPLDSNGTGANNSWWIPISMTDGSSLKFSDTRPVIWLTPNRTSVAIDGPKDGDNWILVNLEYNGYFRVNYDYLTWELLSEQLGQNHTVIPDLNRAQLIDDVFVMGHAKILPYEVAMRLIQYLELADEKAYIRSVAAGHVHRMEQLMNMQKENGDKNQDHPLANIIKTMKTYIYPPSNSIHRDGLTKVEGELYCNIEEDYCAEDVLRIFNIFINGSATIAQEKVVKKNSELVWCTALRHGGHSEWTYAWNTSRLSSTNPSETKKILKAMACARDLTHIKQLLSRVFHPKIDQPPSDTLIILKSLTENPTARRSTLNFVLQNWIYLNKHFQSPSRMREVLLAVTQYSSSAAELEKVKAFLDDKAKELGPGIPDLIVATISSNLQKTGIQNQNIASRNKIPNSQEEKHLPKGRMSRM